MNQKHLPEGPLVVNTKALGRRPGAMRELIREVPASAGIGLEMISVPLGEPLRLNLRIESVAEGVLVSGNVRSRAEGECGRCLGAAEQDLDVSITELYAYPGSATEETTHEDEVSRLIDDRIDLEPAICSAIVLELPLTPLCSPQCEGLCDGCGEPWAQLPSDHEHALVDPRWAALQEKFSAAD